MHGRVVILGLLALAGGCVATKLEDYEASPLSELEGRDGRLVAEVEGVRVQAGPPAVFPYAEEEGGRRRVAGRYQLYTRVVVENEGSEPVQVDWSGVRLVQPAGDTVALVPVGADGAPVALDPGESPPQEAGEARDGVPAPPARGVERIAPGGMVTRSLLPASFREIGVDEPMVSLCDECEYLLLVPVVIGGRRREVRLGFRMNVVEHRDRRARFLFWQ